MRHLQWLNRIAKDQATWSKAALAVALAMFVTAGALAADPESAPATGPVVTSEAPTPEARKPETVPARDDGETVKVIQTGVFDIHARDTDLRAVLTLLSNQGRKNIVATKEVGGKVSADLYGVTFKEALDAILRTTGFKYEEKGNFVFVYTPEQLEKMKKDERKMASRTFRLTYINATDAKTLLAPALSPDAIVAITPASEIGISPSKIEAGGNKYATDDLLVIRDDEEHLAKVDEMLKELDVKPEQVLIEATILKASLSEDNALGIDFAALGGINFDAITHDTGAGLNPTKGNTYPFATRKTVIDTDFAGLVPSGGLSIGLIANQVAMFVRALESVTPTTVLANPKLLVLNKQRGEVLVGNKDGYLTTTITETVATQTVQMLETGTKLVVRPFIGKNGQIRLEIHPEDSSGGVKQVGNTGLPSSTTTELTSNVMVRDGHTIVIGGLFREKTVAGRSQVPGLGNLPGLGALFRQTSDSTTRDEVIILITPRIIKQEVDEAIADQLKDDVERFRVGARKGLQWFGRDRLAQCFMRASRHELDQGDFEKALWDVDLALSMSPQMCEAIQLKERLMYKAYWSNEARVSDVNFVVQRMMMQELGKPFELIVPPQKPLDVKEVSTPKPVVTDDDVRKMFGTQPRLAEPAPTSMPVEECPLMNGCPLNGCELLEMDDTEASE